MKSDKKVFWEIKRSCLLFFALCSGCYFGFFVLLSLIFPYTIFAPYLQLETYWTVIGSVYVSMIYLWGREWYYELLDSEINACGRSNYEAQIATLKKQSALIDEKANVSRKWWEHTEESKEEQKKEYERLDNLMAGNLDASIECDEKELQLSRIYKEYVEPNLANSRCISLR